MDKHLSGMQVTENGFPEVCSLVGVEVEDLQLVRLPPKRLRFVNCYTRTLPQALLLAGTLMVSHKTTIISKFWLLLVATMPSRVTQNLYRSTTIRLLATINRQSITEVQLTLLHRMVLAHDKLVGRATLT